MKQDNVITILYLYISLRIRLGKGKADREIRKDEHLTPVATSKACFIIFKEKKR